MLRRQIEAEAERIISACDSTDPFLIAQSLGAEVRYKELGSLKGMYLCMGTARFIVLNPSLNSVMRREVCAHELGHDLLHQEQARNGALHEFARATGGDRTEYEANVFAAALLIPDDAVLDNLECSPEQFSRILGVDLDLIAIKFQLMSARGYSLPQFPYRSDFLK